MVNSELSQRDAGGNGATPSGLVSFSFLILSLRPSLVRGVDGFQTSSRRSGLRRCSLLMAASPSLEEVFYVS